MVKTGMAEGIRQSLDKLAGVLSGNSTDRGVTVTGRTLTLVRVYPAPRELMWTAYTETLSLEMAMGEEQERAGYGQILDHFAAHVTTLTGG